MTMVAVFAAMNMNAQVYVGGSVGFGSAKIFISWFSTTSWISSTVISSLSMVEIAWAI